MVDVVKLYQKGSFWKNLAARIEERGRPKHHPPATRPVQALRTSLMLLKNDLILLNNILNKSCR